MSTGDQRIAATAKGKPLVRWPTGLGTPTLLTVVRKISENLIHLSTCVLTSRNTTSALAIPRPNWSRTPINGPPD